MPSLDWNDVPEGVRNVAESKTGPVRLVAPTRTGSNAAFTAHVYLANGGEVFCKGAPLSAANLWMYRNEARFNEYLLGIAPALLWTIERDGWLLLGFDSAPGEAAELHRGSRHLPRLATFLTKTLQTLTPAPNLPTQRLCDRWTMNTWRDLCQREQTEVRDRELAEELAKWEAIVPDAVAGASLQHTDMTPNNFLVSVSDRVSLTDWSWPALAAPWVDTALLTHRLIAAGHSPASAEEWAATASPWSAAESDAVTALAVTVWGIWRTHNQRKPALYRQHLANAARLWVEHRLS